ncbi:MAG: hypothetical protein ACRYFU_00240 [Janthinobacterium lividum]
MTIDQVWSLNATYKDQQHGVSFSYPATWMATTQYAYHQPALSQSEDVKPIAGFGYSEGGFPRDQIVGPYSPTTIEGFGIAYSAVPAESESKCNDKAASLADKPSHRRVKILGRGYSVYGTSSAGMSQGISGDLYVTYVRPTCYLFEVNVAEVSIGVVDDLKQLTPKQTQELTDHLLKLVKTIHIVPVDQ